MQKLTWEERLQAVLVGIIVGAAMALLYRGQPDKAPAPCQCELPCKCCTGCRGQR